MTQTREEVLELLAAKRITTNEADQLLVAMESRRQAAWTWVLDPLSRMSIPVALALTVIPIVGQLVLEKVGIHFDGVLDLHTNGQPGSWARAAADAAVGFPLLAIVLWMAALLAKHKARILDVAAAVGLSRWPMTAAGLLLLPLAPKGIERLHNPTGADLFLIIGSLPLVAWSIVLLCLGFRAASGLRGARLAWSFVGGLVVAELISKLALAAAKHL
jgi:hypothetical protein